MPYLLVKIDEKSFRCTFRVKMCIYEFLCRNYWIIMSVFISDKWNKLRDFYCDFQFMGWSYKLKMKMPFFWLFGYKSSFFIKICHFLRLDCMPKRQLSYAQQITVILCSKKTYRLSSTTLNYSFENLTLHLVKFS